MNPPPLSLMRIGLIVACTTVLGTIIGILIALRMPPTFQAWAKIEHPDFAAHPPVLSPLRADRVTYDLDLEHRWAITFEQAAATVSAAVRLEPDPQGVVVVVTLPDAKDAWIIAREVAKGLGTPAQESALATRWPRLAHLTQADEEDLNALARLESLMADQALAAGFSGYGTVVKAAAAGDSKATELARSEDFSRRWTLLQELARKTGHRDAMEATLLHTDARVEVGPIPSKPSEQTGRVVLHAGRLGGLAVGGLLVLVLMRWKPDFMRPAPAEPVRPPVSRRVAPENNDPW